MLRNRLDGRLRDALIAGMSLQVDERHLWRTCRTRALGQRDARVAALCDIFERFQRRCRRAQYDGYGGALGSQHREIARRVAKSLLLLVGGIMLLVDHDQRELWQGRKHGGARADDDAGLTVMRGPPGVTPQRSGESRVQYREAGPEAALKSIHELRRQGNFRDQHERLSAAANRSFDDAQVNLGLAAAGDAVQ